MPIVFTKIRFLNVLPHSTACKVTSYLRRSKTFDRILGTDHNFVRLADDLVYERVWLPAGGPAAFLDPATLARAADAAEAGRIRKRDGRTRWPQVAAAFTIALPSARELSHDERVDLLTRFVDRIRSTKRLPLYVVVHDPHRTTPGALNVHAHILVFLREVDGNGFTGRKIREVFARVRDAGSNGHDFFVAEAMHWPNLSFEIQNGFFQEIGIDLVVDPPSPFPERHWTPSVVRYQPERREGHRAVQRNRNVELIHGPPGPLVETLLRKRGAMRTAELRRFLVRFISGNHEVTSTLDRILGNPSIIGLAVGPSEARPTRLTTRRTCDLMQKATRLVNNARHQFDPLVKSVPYQIQVVSAADGEAIAAGLTTAACHGLFGARRPPLILGVTVSDCAPLAGRLGERHIKPRVATIAAVLSGSRPSLRSSKMRAGIGRGAVVVIPKSENVDDLSLARILKVACVKKASVVLGYDQSRGAGIVANRLAAYAADALAPSTGNDPHSIATLLRAGLVDRAVATMNEMGQLEFAVSDDSQIDLSRVDFVVCDDPKRIHAMTELVWQLRQANGLADPVTIELSQLSMRFAKQQWVVFSRDADVGRAPKIREGQLAQVMEISATSRTICVRLVDGTLHDINLAKCPHVRPAFAIEIRQARYAPPKSSIHIEMTLARRVWSALLFAAIHPGSTRIRVDPTVASDVAMLCRAARASLPGALPPELARRGDPNAVTTNILTAPSRPVSTPVSDFEPLSAHHFDPFPEPRVASPAVASAPPDQPQVAVPNTASFIPLHSGGSDHQRTQSVDEDHKIPHPLLHEELRAILATPDGQTALALLHQAFGNTERDGPGAAMQLMEFVGVSRPLKALLQVLMQERPEVEAHVPDELSDIDLPTELTRLVPRGWSPWELYQFQIDLKTMPILGSTWRQILPPPPEIIARLGGEPPALRGP